MSFMNQGQQEQYHQQQQQQQPDIRDHDGASVFSMSHQQQQAPSTHYSVRNTFIDFTDPEKPLNELYGLDGTNDRPAMDLKARSMPEVSNVDRTASQLASMLFRGGAAFGLQQPAPEVPLGISNMLHQPFSGPPETIPEVSRAVEMGSESSVQGDHDLLSSSGGVGPSGEGSVGSPFESFVPSEQKQNQKNDTAEAIKGKSSTNTAAPQPPKRSTGPTHIRLEDLTEDERNRLLNAIPRDPKTGKMLSAGSIVHELGTCRPCVFANNNERPCVYGVECLFCHYPHDIRKRSRMSRKQRQEARIMRESQNTIGCTLGSPVLPDDAPADDIYHCLMGHAHAVELQKVSLNQLLDTSPRPPMVSPPYTTTTSRSPSRR